MIGLKNTDMSDYTTKKKINHKRTFGSSAQRRTKEEDMVRERLAVLRFYSERDNCTVRG
jgi:hypothetical protein